MSFSLSATTVLGFLQQYRDPISRNELANMTSLTEIEVVKAINELSEIYDIVRKNSGYLLTETDLLPEIKQASPQELIISMLASTNKRLYLRTFVKHLGLPERIVKSIITDLIAENVIHHRIPGTYFLSTGAIDYIATHFPALKINDYTQKRIALEENNSNYTFSIKRNSSSRSTSSLESPPLEQTIQVTLLDIPVKIKLLEQCLANLTSNQAEQIQQLIDFLNLYTEQA